MTKDEEIESLRRTLAQWQGVASQGITIESQLRRDLLIAQKEIQRLRTLVGEGVGSKQKELGL